MLFRSTACDFGDPNGVDKDGNQIIIVDDLNAVKKYADDNAKLNQATIVGDSMKLSISYSGGCQTHEFKLIGLKDFAESSPLQATIYISHNANKDDCEAFLTEELAFDIIPLKEHYNSIYQGGGPIELAIHEPGVYDKSTLVMYVF